MSEAVNKKSSESNSPPRFFFVSDVILVFLLLTLNKIILVSSVSIVDFEQVNEQGIYKAFKKGSNLTPIESTFSKVSVEYVIGNNSEKENSDGNVNMA